MKKILFIVCVIMMAMAGTVIGSQYRIQVKRAALYDSPSMFSRWSHVLEFNTRVEVLGEKGTYYQVRAGNRTGYVHTSAVLVQETFQKRYTTVEQSHSYSSEAVTAATRGFNTTEIEQRKTLGQRARYDLVDQIAAFYIFDKSADLWENFRREGLLGEFRVLANNQHYTP